MREIELLHRIVVEPGKMGGQPIIRGRRIAPAMVLRMLAKGATKQQALEAYPVLEPEDVDACVVHAKSFLGRVSAGG